MDNVLSVLLAKATELNNKGLLPGEQDLIRSLIGAIGEAKVMEITDGEKVNEAHDVLGKKRFVGRIEVKTAYKSTDGLLGAWGILCKRDKCDYVALVDASGMLNDRYRISMIPHDEFFGVIDVPNSKGNVPDFIRWSETYNETDKKSVKSTELFLKYEITL